MEHGWYDLRDNFPQKIKRRYSRLVALLEIVEEEFVELRKLKKQLEGSAAARVKAEMPNVAIDSASLGAFIEQEPLVQELDVSIAAILGCELDQARSEGVLDLRIRVLASSGVKTVENLRELLKRYQKELLAYVADCQPLWARTAPMGTTYEKGICLFHLGMMLIAADSRLRQAIQELGVDLVQSPQSIDEQSRIAMRLLDRTIAGQ